MRKNVTLSADESLIQRARDKARRHRTTLNALFRDWLRRYVDRDQATNGYDELMARLRYARPGRTFTRDEMNER
jgi:predicted transcriptional regulator